MFEDDADDAGESTLPLECPVGSKFVYSATAALHSSLMKQNIMLRRGLG